MRFSAAVLLGLVLAPLSAQADGLPLFQSARYCAHIGILGMTYSTVALDGCIAQEVSARAELERTWTAVPQDLQAHCVLAAGFSGTGSYAALASCLAKAASQAAPASAEAIAN